MATTIKIKSSTVAQKVPDASSLQPAELAVNLVDQKLYTKDASGTVFEIGKGSNVPGGTNPPQTGNEIGDLFFDTTKNQLLYWNGTEWVPINAELALDDLSDVEVDKALDKQVLVYDADSETWIPASAASLAVDVDLGYTPAKDKGTVTNTAGDDAELPLVNKTNAGLMSPDMLDKLDSAPNVTINVKGPEEPELGDIWIDTDDCPPTLNIWSDCDGTPGWKPIGGSGGNVQAPVSIVSSDGTELNATLTAVGGGGLEADGTVVAASYAWSGAKIGTGTSIVADVEGAYKVTATVVFSDGSTQKSDASWTIVDSYVPMANVSAPITQILGGTAADAYEGRSIYVSTNATVSDGLSPQIVENQWHKVTRIGDRLNFERLPARSLDATGTVYTIGAGQVGEKIVCRQLFRDARTNTILSKASNETLIIERPAEVITFTPEIQDDGTDNGNQVGHVLTAVAANIVGGTAATEYAYAWKSGGVAAGSSKILLLSESDVGNVITCDITVAEPDGTNPVTQQAVYSKKIESAGVLKQPTVLGPQQEEITGGTRYLISDAITEVEGGGIDTCETELIESVEELNGQGPGNATYDITQDLADAGITSIAGIRIFKRDDAYTTEINFLKVDGVDVQVTSQTTIAGEPYVGGSTLYDYESFFVTRPDIAEKLHAQGIGDEYSCTLEPLVDITGKTVTMEVVNSRGSADGAIWIIGQGGLEALVYMGPFVKLTFPDSTGFDCFAAGDVVQQPDVKIIGEPDSDNNTIVVDGGEWTGSDGSGTPGEQTTLVKKTPYDTKLTVAGPKDLADMTGSAFMSDGSGASGPYSQTPYKLVTTDIESVENLQGYKFKLYKINNTPSNSVTNLNDIKPITDATYLETVDYGTMPTHTGQVDVAYYELDEPAAVYVTRPEGDVTHKNGSIAWSNDGVTWIGAKFEVPGGLGPDKPVGHDEPYKYWAFWTHGNTHVPKKYAPDATHESIKLTFPGDVSTNPDLRYFKPGDVVGIEETTELPGNQGSSNVSGNAANAFDGNLDSFCTMPGSESSNIRWKSPDATKLRITFEDNGASGQTLQVLTGSAYDQNPGSWVAGTPNTTVNGNQITINSTGKVTADFEITNNQNDFLIDCPTPVGMKIYNIADFAEENVKVVSTGYPDSNDDGCRRWVRGHKVTRSNTKPTAAKVKSSMSTPMTTPSC